MPGLATNLVDAASALVFHVVVRIRAGLKPIDGWIALCSLAWLAAACHKEPPKPPQEEGECTGARCVEQAEAAMYYQDYDHAREPLAAVCDNGDGFGCFRLAELHQQGRGGPVDIDKAAQLYERSCEKEHSDGCIRRAELASAGTGGPTVELDFSVKACMLGVAPACARAGEQINTARGVERDEARAIELFEKACGLGEVDGCTGAGKLLGGPDSPDDAKARALAAFIKACVGHSGYGCLRVGIAFHDGDGAPQDLDKAKSHFTRACDFSDQDGCRAAAQLTAAPGKPITLELTTKAAELSQDGLEARSVSCRMSEHGLPSLTEVFTVVASHKASLDACAKDGAAVAVTWAFTNGRVREAKLKDPGSRKRAKCIETTLRKARIPTTGSCEAVLLLGDPAGAAKALSERGTGDGRKHVRVSADDE